MPTISTTARRLRAYQVTLDRLARPARPAAIADVRLRAMAYCMLRCSRSLLTYSTYFYVVIVSIDLLTRTEVPRIMHSSLYTFAVFFCPVYLTLLPYDHFRASSPRLQLPERHLLPGNCIARACCYLSGLMSDLLFRIYMHCFPLFATATLYTNLCSDNYLLSVQSNLMTRVASAPHKLWFLSLPPNTTSTTYLLH